jgi:hypothetical protein
MTDGAGLLGVLLREPAGNLVINFDRAITLIRIKHPYESDLMSFQQRKLLLNSFIEMHGSDASQSTRHPSPLPTN